MIRYPRTPHLPGSSLQPDDEDARAALPAGHVVIEEKLDGANCGFRFTPEGDLKLQSRGHYLEGGPRERQFALLKSWATRHAAALRERLGSRYLVYGEWLYARHTVFYDRLPHYFAEFDVLDLEQGQFLDTPARRALLEGLPLVSAPVLWQGPTEHMPRPEQLVPAPAWQSPQWRQKLQHAARQLGLDPQRALDESDPAGLAEGLYLKVERDGRVLARAKWVRRGYRQVVDASGSHWADRPLVPNLLAEGVDLFA